MNPILSIIVPVYKVEDYIHRCITSILEQTYNDFELILVDDGSPDNCGIICDDYAKKDSRIIVIHQKNQGLSAARNAGLEIVKGKYITFVDSDDSISSNTYSDNMKILLSDNSIDVLEYPYYKIILGEKQELYDDPSQHMYGNQEIFYYWVIKSKKRTNVWDKIFKREIFSTLRFPNGAVYEDLFLLPDISEHVYHLYVSNKGAYQYYIRQDSISTKKQTLQSSLNHCDSRLKAIKKIKEYKRTDKESIIFYHWWLAEFIGILKDYPNEDLNRYIIQFESINYSTIHILTSKLRLIHKIKFIFIKYLGIRSYIYISNLRFRQ